MYSQNIILPFEINQIYRYDKNIECDGENSEYDEWSIALHSKKVRIVNNNLFENMYELFIRYDTRLPIKNKYILVSPCRGQYKNEELYVNIDRILK